MSNYDRDVAIAIGYHFWHCETDAQAEANGRDAAIDVARRLSSVEAKPRYLDPCGKCHDCGSILTADRLRFCHACDPETP